MKSKQLKITHYFKKKRVNNQEVKMNGFENRKFYRKSMKKKNINERKLKFCLYELSRVRI
jgi:hypothetical protein